MAAADIAFTATKLVNSSEVPDPATGVKGNLDVFYATLTLASQAKSKTIGDLTLPAGFTPLKSEIYATVSLGSSKISVGTEASSELYRAGATHTTELVPEVAGIAPAALAEDTAVRVFNDGTADLPSSGTLVVSFYGRRD